MALEAMHAVANGECRHNLYIFLKRGPGNSSTRLTAFLGMI